MENVRLLLRTINANIVTSTTTACTGTIVGWNNQPFIDTAALTLVLSLQMLVPVELVLVGKSATTLALEQDLTLDP